MPIRKIEDREDWIPKICSSPDHNPPQHMVFPSGVYEHECPLCGRITVFTVIKPSW